MFLPHPGKVFDFCKKREKISNQRVCLTIDNVLDSRKYA